MIGVAIAGTGFGQKVHIPGFQAHPQTEVVAVYHRDINKAKAIAASHHIPHACDTIAEIVALPEVQAVSISTPPFLHYEMAKTVLQAEKHLLLEKPVTLNVFQAKELYELAKNKGVIATVDFEFRFIPGWQFLSELLSQGYVGDLRLIKIDWLGSSRADTSRPWNWYSSKEKGVVHWGLWVPTPSIIFTGYLGSVRRLSAHLNTAIPTRIDPSSGEIKPVETDDNCLLSLELANGTPCQVAISAVVHASRTHWVEVYGDRATLVLGSENQKDYIHGFRLWGSQPGKPLTEIEIPNRLIFPKNHTDGRISAFIRVIDQWVQGIECQQQTMPSLREGIYSQLLMDLSHQSHTTATWVDVPSLEAFLAKD